MYHIMDLTQKRRIYACNTCFLQHGEPHPSRTLTDMHDLLYIAQGSWEVVQGNETHVLKANDALLLQAGVPHYGAKPCQDNTLTMYVHFSVNRGDAVTSASDTTNWPDALLLPSVTRCGGNDRIKSLFDDIVRYYHSSYPNVRIKLAALMDSLIYELFLASMIKTLDSSDDEIVAGFLTKLRESPHINYTLEQAARELFVSPRTLSGHIKSATGMTFAQYQKHIKLENIRRILVNEPQLTIREIALSHGFCDEFHFSNVFKKVYDVSPSQYRRQTPHDNPGPQIKPSGNVCG